jgi:polyhydroxyalkanoate synthesis regulator phasin
MNAKKWVVSGVMVVVLAAASVGAAAAQEEGRFGGRGDRPLRQVVETVANEIGISARELAQQVRGGSTVADVIAANGGDVAAVTAAAVAEATEQINQAVADGRITQERADFMLQNVEEWVTAAINGDLPRGGRFGDRERVVLDAITEATGLAPQQIAQQVRDGATLAEIISANGGDVDAIIDLAVQTATERINQAVANGRITQDEANELLTNLDSTITELFNTQNPGQALRERWRGL